MTISEFINKVGFKVKDEDVDKVNSTISGIKSTATKLLGAIGIGFGLSAINSLIEEFGNVNDSIQYTLGGLEDCEEVQNKILEAANNCRTAYSTLASSANSLAQANAELFPLDEAATFVEYTTKLGKAAGYTDSQISSMNTNLQKAVSAGVMSSTVFSQLKNSAPALINTLSEGLGVTTSELEAMAAAGTLTASTIKTAMLNATDSIDAAFSNTSMTISDALLNIRNKWGLWLAQTDETLEITQTIAKTMVSGFNAVMGVLNKVRNGVIWLSDKLGGAQNLLKLIAIAAGTMLVAFNFSKITSGLSSILKLITSIKLSTLAIIAVIVLVALLVEDFFNFMQGNDSLIGSLLEKAGVDVDAVRQKILDAWTAIKKFLLAAWDAIKAACTAVWGAIKDFFAKHGEQIKTALVTAWNVIKTVLSTVWNALKAAATAIFGGLQSFWQNHGEEVKSALSAAWNAIKTVLTTVWNIIKTVATTIFGGLSSFWQKHGEQLKTSFSNIWSGIKNVLSAVWTVIKVLATTIFNGLKAFWDTWGSTIITLFTGIWEVIKAVFGAVFDALADLFAIFSDLFAGNWSQLWEDVKILFSDIWNGIVNILSTVLTAIWNVISSVFSVIWEFISSIASSIWEAITTAFTNIWTSIVETVGNIKNSIVEGFQAAIDWIKSLPAQAIQWGADIIQGIVDGITGAIGKVGEAVSGVASKIKSFLGFSEPEDGPLSDFHTYMPDMIDLMSKGIQAGREKIKGALGDLTGDMSVMASANVVSSGTAAAAAGSSQISKSVVQNIEINNKFEGDRAGQQKSSEAMDKATKDSTAELARGLAYAR